ARGTKSAALTAQDPLAGLAVKERRIYPIVGFPDGSIEFGDHPFSVRFRGTLEAPSAGEYTFDMLCNGRVVLMIDGAVVDDNTGTSPETGNPQINNLVEGTAKLTAGQHTVDLRYAWEKGPSRLEWLWTPLNVK